MLAIILSFLKSHWQTSLIAAGVLAVITTLSVQHLEIGHLKRELSACHAESVTLEDSNQRLVAAIGEQNDAITALKAAGVAKKNAGARALAVAKQRAGEYMAAAKHIEAAPVSSDDCDDLRRLIDNYTGSKK
jgi:hypothetical protein